MVVVILWKWKTLMLSARIDCRRAATLFCESFVPFILFRFLSMITLILFRSIDS
jgi:hypothetical protein